MRKGVVFDLDDTIYFEIDYVRSGFKEISRFIAQTGIYNSKEIYRFLLNSFRQGIRGKNFDLMLQNFPLIRKYFCIEELVNIYRSHIPKIKILYEAGVVIRNLRKKGYLLGIITDGYLISQKNKVYSLSISEYFDAIIYTDEYGKQYWKPNEFAFQLMSDKLGLPHSKLCYVADNPQKDFLAPNKLKWLTIRFKHPKQLHYSEEADSPIKKPNLILSNLLDLETILENRGD